jgi:hypothetical protein
MNKTIIGLLVSFCAVNAQALDMTCEDGKGMVIHVRPRGDYNGHNMTHVYKGKVTMRTKVDSIDHTKRGMQVWAGDVRLADLKEIGTKTNYFTHTMTLKGWYDYDGETDPSDVITCTTMTYRKR